MNNYDDIDDIDNTEGTEGIYQDLGRYWLDHPSQPFAEEVYESGEPVEQGRVRFFNQQAWEAAFQGILGDENDRYSQEDFAVAEEYLEEHFGDGWLLVAGPDDDDGNGVLQAIYRAREERQQEVGA